MVIVRDMSDKNAVLRKYPQHRDAKFTFLKDADRSLTGWTPEHIYFSEWCYESPDFDSISPMLSYRRAQGAKIVCLAN